MMSPRYPTTNDKLSKCDLTGNEETGNGGWEIGERLFLIGKFFNMQKFYPETIRAAPDDLTKYFGFSVFF